MVKMLTNMFHRYSHQSPSSAAELQNHIQEEPPQLSLRVCDCPFVSVTVPQCLWSSLSVCGRPSMSVVIPQCLWLSLCACDCPPVSAVIPQCLIVPSYLWLSLNVCGRSSESVAVPLCLRLSLSVCRDNFQDSVPLRSLKSMDAQGSYIKWYSNLERWFS